MTKLDKYLKEKESECIRLGVEYSLLTPANLNTLYERLVELEREVNRKYRKIGWGIVFSWIGFAVLCVLLGG